jgi:hypothetical protein|tara:strand:+ start:133 stop:777 length:645 start_codon:yes stop_codon:yes gene_type:complete
MISDEILLERFNKCNQSIPYQNHGIMPMEAFALCKYIKDNEITVLIESGTAYGYSTEVLGNMFPDIKIITIDIIRNYGQSVQNITQDRLSYLNNVSCVVGDSNKELPKLIDSFKEETIAIFIDGPKGKDAKKLAYKCNEYDNVVFSACHDQMELQGGSYVPNLDPEFCKKYKFLDSEVDLVKLYEPHYKGQTIGEWFPKGMGITFYPPTGYIFN